MNFIFFFSIFQYTDIIFVCSMCVCVGGGGVVGGGGKGGRVLVVKKQLCFPNMPQQATLHM